MAGSQRIILTVSVPSSLKHLLEKAETIRLVEGWTMSEIMLRGLAMIVNEKEKAVNPQIRLDGRHVTFTEISESKVIAGIRELRKHGYTYRDIAKIVPNYKKSRIQEICRPLKKFRGKNHSRVSLNKMKEEWKRWLLGIKEHLFEKPTEKRKNRAKWKSCTKPVTPACMRCSEHFDCPRYREEAP